MIRYQITNGRFAEDPDAWFERLRRDVDFIQIREKELGTRELADLVRRVISVSAVPILVNDRIDVAVACGAAGVHLRAQSVSPAEVRKRFALVVTAAAHNEDDLRNSEGADYILLAPIFPPLSKPDDRPPLGLEALRRMATWSPAPLLALGGITSVNAEACVQAGAAGVAGITFAMPARACV